MIQTEIDDIVRLRRGGYGCKRIAQETGLPLNTVKTYCRRHPTMEDAATQSASCKQCGKAIQQKSHTKQKMFCSDSCRMAWWNAHSDQVKRKAYYVIICSSCGSSFQSYGNADRKFCSRACYADYRKKGTR